MKITFSDFKKGTVKMNLTEPEDGWYLSQIIDSGDTLSGKTTRKVTVGTKDTKTSHTQKQLFLAIIVEKVELQGDTLRVSGTITNGPDDIARGTYHTFSLTTGTSCTLTKETWLSYHKKYLTEAAESTQKPILICVFDRDDAYLALSRQYGYDLLTKLEGDPAKKEQRAQTKNDLYNKRHSPHHIILASPAFYKEDLAKQIQDETIKKKIVLSTCSSSSENAINEVLHRPETKHAMQEVRVAQEADAVEKVLTAIAKEEPAVYGIKEVTSAVQAGAASELLITDTLLRTSKENGTFKELNELMKQVDNLKGTIHIISTSHEAGKKLQGLGGIAAMLRYAVAQ
jgi:protein pelota